jgi:cell division protein FtsI/penicillin-binding protein 2
VLAVAVLSALILGIHPFSVDAKSRSKSSSQKSKKSATKRTTTKASKSSSAKSSRSKTSKRSASKRTSKKGPTKREREAARRAARAAAEARRREAARLAAIRRFDEQLRTSAAKNITKDVTTNEDPYVRRAALDALGNRAGTVLVMDPNNGRVLSIVNQTMAVRTPIKPCSTIKPYVALAALSEGLMPESDTRTLRACNCEVDMDDALAYSNNEYFQQLGRQLGIGKLNEYYRQFGLGERTGVNLPGESPGYIPDETPSKGLGRVASHGDGVGLTALQLATFVSAIANGGSIYQPQIVPPGKRFTPVLKRQLKIDPKHRRAILEGMANAVEHGTAKRANDAPEEIAGKTGSCLGHGSWVGLFASFANLETPNLVVVVITQGSGARGKYAADIAGNVYRSVSARYGSTASRPRRIGDEPTPTLVKSTNK